jgi:hypothetical protein
MSTPPVTPTPTTASTATEIAGVVQSIVASQISVASAIQAQVKALPGVTEISAYSSSFDAANNSFSVDISVESTSGPMDISTTISTEGFGANAFGEVAFGQ